MTLDDSNLDNRHRLRLGREVLSFRTVAVLPAVLFAPTLIGVFFAPHAWWGTTLGILFHVAAFFFVSRVPAPAWARAAGFGWLALDVAVGIMTLNLVPFDIYMPLRLGGHVIAAMWLITVSLLSRGVLLKVLGLVTAVWLALFSFFGSVLPISLLGPPGILIVVWFVLAGALYEPDPLGGVRRRTTTRRPKA